MQVLLFHLEEAGLRYVPQKNIFREVESTGPPRPRCAKLGLKRPKSQPSTTVSSIAPQVPVCTPSQVTASQTIMASQPPITDDGTQNSTTAHAVLEGEHVSEQKAVSPDDIVQESVPDNAQAASAPPGEEASETNAESQNPSESNITATCEDENKTSPGRCEPEPSLDGSIDLANNDLNRDEISMDTETDISNHKVTVSDDSQPTTVLPIDTATTEKQNVQSSVKTDESDSNGQDMVSITDKKKALDAASEGQIETEKPESPKVPTEELSGAGQSKSEADSAPSVAETSQNSQVAETDPSDNMTTVDSCKDLNTAKAEADICHIDESNNATGGNGDISNLKGEEESSEKSENNVVAANVDKTSCEPSIKGSIEVDNQQQQPSLVPYENEDSSSSNEGRYNPNGDSCLFRINYLMRNGFYRSRSEE